MSLVFYTSGHGFGHASRDIEVINAISRRQPDRRLLVRTSVPDWFFATSVERPVELFGGETDTGIAQIDSLHSDGRETARRAAEFYSTFETRVSIEADWLRDAGATLAVVDAPPLACAAAARAGIPSIVLANFTWDWIYASMDGFADAAQGVLETIRRAYAQTTHALRLPLHGGFAPMAGVVRDVPFVARRARHSRTSAREVLGLDGRVPIVLASFGGHGMQMPYERFAADGRLIILLTEFESSAAGPGADPAQVRRLSRRGMKSLGLRYEDLVIAADVVISKPGYGIVSECIANRTALLYTSRGQMAEYDLLVEEMPRLLRCRYLPQGDVLAGRWADGVDALMAQPDAPETPMTDGADVAAEFILMTAR